jgi:hypothetical protein
VLVGELGPPYALVAYGFPVAVTCPENTIPFVTNGDTQVGYSVGCTHFIFPVFISMAVIVPLPMPFSIELKSGIILEPSVDEKQLRDRENRWLNFRSQSFPIYHFYNPQQPDGSPRYYSLQMARIGLSVHSKVFPR